MVFVYVIGLGTNWFVRFKISGLTKQVKQKRYQSRTSQVVSVVFSLIVFRASFVAVGQLVIKQVHACFWTAEGQIEVVFVACRPTRSFAWRSRRAAALVVTTNFLERVYQRPARQYYLGERHILDSPGRVYGVCLNFRVVGGCVIKGLSREFLCFL